MDYSKLYNPFDFANPVIDPKLFAGRKSELEDIEYYLNNAKNAPRAINLALIGDRASGKTSLLNMIEGGAKQRGFCTVRIDLDESDVETQLIFFLKIFDGIITSVCRENAFGGILGKTYDTYRSIVDAYGIPDDRTFCPFIFPMQFAKAMGNGNNLAPVSDFGFKEDIIYIHNEIKRPIAILFDECDVLTKSRVHLEKLRNIFMNISGFFIVFTGTGSFFPLINEVFSPIIRQFKKINVKSFDSEQETKECIEKPLRSLGINTEEIFDFETYNEIDAIHNLSGGRPYEIQLLCHHLFKRVQQGKATKLELSVDVLDDVLNELQSLQDVTVRPIVQQIRGLTKDELTALGVLLMSNRQISFEQAWFLEYIFNDATVWTRESLQEKLETLVLKNIIKINENSVLVFEGDDFDRIYSKYYSRKLGIYQSINDVPFRFRLRFGIDYLIRKNLKCLQMEQPYTKNIDDDKLESIIGEFSIQKLDFFDVKPEIAEILYKANLKNQDLESFLLVYLSLTTPWEEYNALYTIEEVNDGCSIEKCMMDFERIFQDIEARIQETSSILSLKFFTIPIIPLEVIKDHALKATNKNLKNEIANMHLLEMYECYTEIRDFEGAKFHGELSFQFSPEPENIQYANNLGYLFMSCGEIQKAKTLLEHAIRQSKITDEADKFLLEYLDNSGEGIAALAYYNLGIVYAMLGDFENAVKMINISIEKTTYREDNQCACLFLAKLSNNALDFTEVFDPDLLVTANSSLESLRLLEAVDNN